MVIQSPTTAEIKEATKKLSKKAGIKLEKFNPVPFAEKILEQDKFLFDKFKRFWRYDTEQGIWKEDAEIFIRNKLRTLLFEESEQKKHYAEEIVCYIKDLSWKQKDIEEPLMKVCLKNGVLNLETLEIEEHSPKYFFVNRVNAIYDKEADCPMIKTFFSQIVNEENVILLQELIGYCLYKEHFIHKAMMLVGAGANGKSTFLNLLKEFLGHENIASVPLQFLEFNRFAVSSLHGKLANIFADLSSKALSGTSIFKMLVGQDYVPAERKFKEQFFFTNYAKMLFSANQIPKSPEDTNAFFRRWIIINFPNEFYKNADKTLIKKISTEEELSGLLNFAIEGLKRILEQGDFSLTKSLEEVREQYIRMSDSVGAFEMDVVLSSPDDYVEKKELYTRFCDYCREKSYPIEAENTFHKELQKKVRVEDYRPLLEKDGKKIRVQCWKGIRLNDEIKVEKVK